MTNSIYIHNRDEVSNILEAERLNYLPWLVLVVLHTFPLLSSPQLSCTWRLEALVPLALSIAHWHCLQNPAFVLSQAATQQWTHKATRRRHTNILILIVLEQGYQNLHKNQVQFATSPGRYSGSLPGALIHGLTLQWCHGICSRNEPLRVEKIAINFS